MRSKGSSLIVIWELALVLTAASVVLLVPSGSVGLTNLIETAFLAGLVVVLNQFRVRLARGHLRLTMIGTHAAALVLPVPLAVVVGLASALAWLPSAPRGQRHVGFGQPVFRTAAGAAVVYLGGAIGIETAAAWSASIVSMTAINLSLTPILAWLRDRESIITTLRCTIDRGFAYSFVYFALSGSLVAGVLDGTSKGYVLSLLAAALSVSLVEMLAQERARRQLEEEILDHQRYVAYTRDAEGLFHGLRNNHAVVRHALDELEVEQKESSDSLRRAQRAICAASDQLNMVARTMHGATAGSLRTIDLGGVASDAAVIYTAFARSQDVKILTRCRPGVLVKGDELLLKDVVGNLIKNAVEASTPRTEVQLTVRRSGDRALLVVEDRGPGLDPSHKERLFEPHFTTKASGTGLGLFTAYGVIRQHRGRLVYSDRPGGGAAFSVELPLFAN